MNYKLEDLIDIPLFQNLQEKLNVIYSFPSAIIDNDGKILTAVAWQDICTKFHRINTECEKECIKSDRYILQHISEANPAVSYQCPHGLIDNATPIIIDGKHLGNFFTGQFFLEKPDPEFFKEQAKKYGFNEKEYLQAVEKVPVWSKEKLFQYLDFIKGFIEIIAGIGLRQLKEIESNKVLKEKERRHQVILQTAMDGFWVADMQGRLLEVNDAYCRMSGYTRQELLNMNISDIEVLESSEDTIAHINRIIKTVEDRFESRHRRKDGNIIDVEMSVQYQPVIGESLIGFIRDITKRKQAESVIKKSENELKESEKKFRLLTEKSSTGIYVMQDEKIAYVNPSIAESYGFSSEEMINNLSLEELIHPDDYQTLMRKYKERFEGKSETGRESDTYRGIRKNGSIVFFEVYGMVINYRGRPAIMGTMIDITERKLAEEALQAKMDELLRFRKITVGRELAMIELKKEVNELLKKSGQEEKYRIVG